MLGARRLGNSCGVLLPCHPPGPPAGEGEGFGGPTQSVAHTSPSLSCLLGPWSQGHQVPAGNSVPSPSGRVLRLKSRSLHPALRLLLGCPEPAEGPLLPAGEHPVPEAPHLGALPAGAGAAHLTPRPLGLPPALGALLAPGTSSDFRGSSLALCLFPNCCPSHDLSHLPSGLPTRAGQVE